MLILYSSLLGIGFILFAGMTESLQIEEKYGSYDENTRKKLGTAWHTTQMLERIFAIAFGFSVYFVYNETGWLYTGAAYLFTFVVLFKVLYDGTINLWFNRGFFHVSQTTTSTMEKWTPWYVKVGLLIVSMIALIFIPRKEQKHEDRDSGSL